MATALLGVGWFTAGFRLDSEGTTSGYRYRYTKLTRGFNLPGRQKKLGVVQ
jgi:hypothetical protein